MNDPSEPHRIQLELRIDGTAPTGHVCVAGSGQPRAFSGWVGLVRAVEELVTETRETAGSAT
jgi:hypothetical protein